MRKKGEKRDTRPENGDGEEDDLEAKLDMFVRFGIMPTPTKRAKVEVPKKLASIPLSSRIKRPVPPVVVNGVVDSPAMIKLYNEYKHAEDAYPRKVLEAKAGIVKELGDAGITREQRGDTMLRYECDVKDIDNTGVRLLLLERLAKHDRGEAVLTKELKAAERIEGKQVVSTLVTHRVPSMCPRGEDGLLCLNHDLLRVHVLPRICGGLINRLGTDLHPYIHAQGAYVLFALARTCTYLRDDALFLLNDVSRRVFSLFSGVGGNGRYEMTFTPLAYSCYLYYCRLHKDSSADVAVTPFMLTRMCQQLQVNRSKCTAFLQGEYKTYYVRTSYTNWFLHRGHGHETIRAVIVFAVRTWGSIEGVLRERQKAAERTKLKEQEKASVFSRALDRIKAANAALTQTFGIPAIVKEAQPQEGCRSLAMTAAGEMLLARTGPSWIDKLRDHVLKERPITLKPVFKLLEAYLEPLGGGGAEKGNIIKCICWTVDALPLEARGSDTFASRLVKMVERYLWRVIECASTWNRSYSPWRLLNCEGRALVDDVFMEKFIRWIVSERPRVHTPNTLLTTPVAFEAWAAGGGATQVSYADYLLFIWEDFSLPPHTFACARGTLANGEVYQMIVESRSVFRSMPHKIRPLTNGWSIDHTRKAIAKPPLPFGMSESKCPEMGVFFIFQ